jgi:hypothetical protein
MYLLQYVKDDRVIESHDVYVNSVDFDFTFNATKNKVQVNLNSAFGEETTANITIEVIDRNETLVFNKTEQVTANIGTTKYETNYSFCKFCDLYITADINGYSIVKGINLATYDDFVLSKQKKSNNAILYIAIIVIIVIILFFAYNFWFKKKYH